MAGLFGCDDCYVLRLGEPPTLPWLLAAGVVGLCVAIGVRFLVEAVRHRSEHPRGDWLVAAGFLVLPLAVIPLARNNTFVLPISATTSDGVALTRDTYVACDKALYVPWNGGMYETPSRSAGRTAAERACRDAAVDAGHWSLLVAGIGFSLLAAGFLTSTRRSRRNTDATRLRSPLPEPGH